MRIYRPLPIALGLSLVLLTGVADATSTTCTTTVVCAEYINSSSGVAIHGEANTGVGIRGTSNGSTGFYGASRSGNPLFPGVEGESLDQTGDDAAGAFGLTAAGGGPAPAYGVIAYGSAYGVYGDAVGPGTAAYAVPASIGVAGSDGGGQAGNDHNVGVYGSTPHGTAVLAIANAPNAETYSFGTEPIGVLGVAEAETAGGNALAIAAISKSLPFAAYNPSTAKEVDLDGPKYTISTSGFTVDGSGNIIASSLKTTKGTYTQTIGPSGTARTLYAQHSTSPVTEDFGEGQLVGGRGYVRLDPALADVIDNRNAYHVFLTPEGDSKGLYVTQKTPAGFVVRESGGGRSTLAFEYRILAKPVDEDGRRLAVAPPLPHDTAFLQPVNARSTTAAEPLDPFARLKLKLGPAAYARALKAARLVQAGP